MEQKINKIIPIIGASIAFETVIIIFYLFVTDLSPLLFFSFFATYILMLFFAKRSGLFDNTSFLQALLSALLISAPVILIPPVISLFSKSVISRQLPNANMDWIPLFQNLSVIYLVKFIYAAIVAFIFCTRLEAIIGISDEKELRLYGAATQGIICRKWQHRHLRFVRAEYHINGRRYETDSKPDHKNLFSENDTITIIYSTRYPLISIIKELADQNISYASIEAENQV